MECCNSSMLASLLPTMLVFLTTAFIVIRKVYQSRACKLPPGPRGLPIIGHLHLLGKLPHQSLYELSKIHGPLMSLRLGSVPLIVASSSDMARQILQTHDLAFADRMQIAVANNLFRGCMDIAFSPPNAYWKLMRRLCATELFSTKGLNFFKPVRIEEVRALMRSVLSESVDVNDKFEDVKPPQQMRPKLKVATNDIIMRMMMGKRFSELGGRQGQEGSHKASIVELIEEMVELVGMFNVGDFLPGIAWMDLQGCERRSKRLAAQLRAVFEDIIDARRVVNTDGRAPNDYLDVLLQASSSDTPIYIMEVLLDLFVGGTDTASITVEWALVELLANPEKMRKAQAEIDEVVGRARMVEEEDIQHLPFLVACVKETMRLHPPLPFLVPHKANQASKILDFHIPTNMQAYVNVWAIGRDPKVWENPTNFLPERFLEVGSVDVTGQHFELLPFGSGRRICPGWKLGLLTVHIILASLLQGFEWNFPPSHHLDMSESFHLILSLATPLVVYTTPRLPKELF